MFGYVTAYEPELKLKDFQRYKEYYCGLCRTLRERHGILGQLTLTYDMTFIILLLTSLYECETRRSMHRCEIHPVKKRGMLQSEITEYAADLNLILAYYHEKDDWEDEKKPGALAGSAAIRRKAGEAAGRWPRQARAICRELRKLAEYEKAGTAQIDEPAGCFGRLMGELFLYKKDHWERSLRRMGFYLGKFIYIMDAYEDLEKDAKSGNYNPLREIAGEQDYEKRCGEMLAMMMGECTAEFERLPCILDVDILRNILYDGVWKRYHRLQEKKREEQKA